MWKMNQVKVKKNQRTNEVPNPDVGSCDNGSIDKKN